MKRAYAPFVITAVPCGKDGSPDIMVVNDGRDPCKLTARVETWSFSGKLLGSVDFPVEVAYAQAAKAGKLPTLGNDSFAQLSLLSEDGTILATHTYISGEYKDCALAAPTIQVKATPSGPVWSVRLESDLPAFFVWVEAEGIKGHFSDNAITLIPGRPVDLTFIPSDPGASFVGFEKELKVKDLASVYHDKKRSL